MVESNNWILINGDYWPRRVWLFCLFCALILVLLDAFLNYGKLLDVAPLRRVFNITREDGLATWFMVVQTFCVSAALAAIALLHRANRERASRTAAWCMLSVFFLYLSADDGAEIHERLGSTFKAAAQDAEGVLAQAQGWFPSYDWQLVVLPFFVLAGLLMLAFLIREITDNRARKWLLLAPALIACALLLDFFEGIDEGHALSVHTWIRERFDLREYTVSHFSKSLEELLEMSAMATFLRVFLHYLLQAMSPTLTFTFERQQIAE